jgi:hypothetical protein
MPNIAKIISWLTPVVLFVSLPTSANPISITETIDNSGFEIMDQFVEVEEGVATEFEVIERWSSTENPEAHKTVTINYDSLPLANPFEFRFEVTNYTGAAWSSYSFSFSGLGDLALSDVLVDWENEIFNIDDNPAFLSSGIVGDKLSFYNGAHLSGDMVAYELFFDLNALEQAGITELAIVQAVPLPAAAWLFGTGLISLIGIARRKKS